MLICKSFEKYKLYCYNTPKLRSRLMVGHRPLKASILVRIQAPQQKNRIAAKRGEIFLEEGKDIFLWCCRVKRGSGGTIHSASGFFWKKVRILFKRHSYPSLLLHQKLLEGHSKVTE